MVSAGTTSAFRLFASVRLRKISIWSAPLTSSSSAAPTTVAIEYVSSTLIGGKRQAKSSSSVSPAVTAFVELIPNPGSLADMWISSASTAALFKIDCPDESLLDFELDVVFAGDEPGFTITTTNGAAAGTVGLAELNASTGTGDLAPVSLQSIGDI